MMIDRGDPLPVGKQAKQLGISRGTVYDLPRATSPADLARMRQIDQLHLPARRLNVSCSSFHGSKSNA